MTTFRYLVLCYLKCASRPALVLHYSLKSDAVRAAENRAANAVYARVELAEVTDSLEYGGNFAHYTHGGSNGTT